MVGIVIEDLDCPECSMPHEDINEWSVRPHKTHLCLHCGALFEGSVKAVSRPRIDPHREPEECS